MYSLSHWSTCGIAGQEMRPLLFDCLSHGPNSFNVVGAISFVYLIKSYFLVKKKQFNKNSSKNLPE
jgi:hypothetical protein